MTHVGDEEVNCQILGYLWDDQLADYHSYKPFLARPNVTDDELKDLIRRIATLDPQKRATARKALEHAWFAGRAETESPHEVIGGGSSSDRIYFYTMRAMGQGKIAFGFKANPTISKIAAVSSCHGVRQYGDQEQLLKIAFICSISLWNQQQQDYYLLKAHRFRDRLTIDAKSTFATFSVPLTCDACIEEVSKPLYALDGRWDIYSQWFILLVPYRNQKHATHGEKYLGIKSVQGNLNDQLLLIEGTAAPSAIVAAIQSTGRDAILRGSGSSNNASVCILETHSSAVQNSIRGLARMVQVAPKLTLVDLTINGLPPGKYWATVRDTGDISQGPASAGGIWEALNRKVKGSAPPRGVFGEVEVGSEGKVNAFLDRPVAVWELIGRSMVVSKSQEGPFQREDPNTLVGVIARSAGVWDNDKMVCSCSGKNIWEERVEQVSKGMM
ncbi:hypothetical protein ACJ73_05477 [Blastomyces percursus]|uniref:Superoxide dismutase copper/zinc binding domain-containing protein n=1 Tax=Blastomyces percursus TaxID=1658174 RepID=A0A1J9QSG4_9EURO|nr:hypothetical protein ACJ73_05477 [Blastomyces percursus]